ncbi:MAG TPA: hypothetical protein VJN18_00700 [Polyangiaceae bacterium]|nr:hypothetical protein [Polyangiaceae bacterium]
MRTRSRRQRKVAATSDLDAAVVSSAQVVAMVGGGEPQGGRAVGVAQPEAGTTGLTGSGDILGGAPPAACNQGKGATISGRILAPNGELP